MAITTIIVFVLILALLVLVHEAGHLIVAKKNGLKVDEFGIGFPPRIAKIKRGGTIYSLNLIPLGGFVKEDEKSFRKKDLKTRAQVIVAGVGMNIALAIVLLSFLCFFMYPWYKAIYMGLAQTGQLIILIFKGFAWIIGELISTGRLSQEVLGPVGIANLTGQIIKQGWLNIVFFTAILSLNLAVINILPFPALDGGRLLFLLIEKIKGGKVSQKIENIVHTIGFAFLILLMIVITWRDIARLF